MNFFHTLKRKLKFGYDKLMFERGKDQDISELSALEQSQDKLNYLWITYDSCRYDTLLEANTPVLDSYAKKIYSAWTPGTYTLPAHTSFFSGILPLVYEEVPYLNRFYRQLVTMRKSGEVKEFDKDDYSILLPESKYDIIHGMKQAGYYTVGSASTTWFAKDILVRNYDDFKYRRAQSFPEQANFILSKLNKNARERPFFAFMNLIETHSPYMHYGEDRQEYAVQARGSMSFPPKADPELMATRGKKLHKAQIAAAEYIDTLLGEVLAKLPKNTFVMIMADHGECFGEDGFWGHGIYHPKVMNVPMACFTLDRKPIEGVNV